jgi:hypothetical protein
MSSAAHRREKVAGQTHVQHLFNGDLHDRLAPSLYTFDLLLGNPFRNIPLHTEGAIQIAAHDPVLKLGGFGQHVDKLSSIFYSDQRNQYRLPYIRL